MKGRKYKPSVTDIPKSSTSTHICLIGVISFMVAVYYIRVYQVENYMAVTIAALALVLPIIILELLELKTHNNTSTGINYKIKNNIDIKRVAIKLLGLYFTIGLVLFFYWSFPEYLLEYYSVFWPFARIILFVILIGAIPYFFILDRYLVEPRESYWKVGMIILGRRKEITTEGLKDHFLGWLVKAFFLPLMYIGLITNIGVMKGRSFGEVLQNLDQVYNQVEPSVARLLNFNAFFEYLYDYIYTIDLAFVTVGYLLTLRIFDSHIRTVEPSFLGWFVAIQCYRPFWDSVGSNYLAYNNDGFSWGQWLHMYPSVYIFWGILILVLISIYSWASAMFGIRFSNLTNRGILTNGPYRWMKHPAYITKNLSWWLISIPFITQTNFGDGLRNCLLLLCVNFLYYMRARTEERHLSKDPKYVMYAIALNELGLFRKVYNVFPFLKYNAEKYRL